MTSRHFSDGKTPTYVGKIKSISTQPCWSCAKCCGKCSWSYDFTPIKNWKATQTSIRCRDDITHKIVIVDSFSISHCPEYEYDNLNSITNAEIDVKLNVKCEILAKYLRHKFITKDDFSKIINEELTLDDIHKRITKPEDKKILKELIKHEKL